MEKDKKVELEPTETPKSYKFMIGFVISIALLIFLISATLLLIKVVPDGISLVANTYQSVKEEVEESRGEHVESFLSDKEISPELRESNFHVILLGVGEILGSHRGFYKSKDIDIDDELAIKFRVLNIGEETTGGWLYEVDVDEPAYSDDLDYVSETFPSLARGEYVDITATLDDLDKEGQHRITIRVKPNNTIDEKDTRNNRLKLKIDIEE